MPVRTVVKTKKSVDQLFAAREIELECGSDKSSRCGSVRGYSQVLLNALSSGDWVIKDQLLILHCDFADLE